jgi:hypothetical protein
MQTPWPFSMCNTTESLEQGSKLAQPAYEEKVGDDER